MAYKKQRDNDDLLVLLLILIGLVAAWAQGFTTGYFYKSEQGKEQVLK